MKKLSLKLLFLTVFSLTASATYAQDVKPSISPVVHYKYYDEEGVQQEKDDDAFSGSAPAEATFYVNPSDNDGWDSNYELVITRVSSGTSSTTTEPEVILDRYLGSDDETDYTFNDAGSFKIVINATFISGNDTIRYTDEDWSATCSISESNLVMPNAFTPGTGSENDHYKPKEKKSIIEFHAKIFNRWGQKLYEWDDVNGEGWDGTYQGRQVKDGVYYCLVHAKGADGRKFTIRKDVNILRRIDPSYEGSSNTGGN